MRKNISLVKFLTVVVFLSVCVIVQADTPGISYTCVLMNEIPVLDGVITNDPAWEPVPFASNIFVIYKTDIPAERQTYFKAGYTLDGLYLAVICDEPDTLHLTADSPDMGRIWKDDSIEIFIAPNKSVYYHFAANAAGARYNAVYTHMEKSGNKELWNWKIVTSRKKDYWSAEIYIPFSIFCEFPGEPDNTWLFNIGHNSKTIPPEISSWSPAPYSFHDLQSFGKLIFRNKLAPDEKDRIHIKRGQWRLQNRINIIRKSWEAYITRWQTSKDPFYALFLKNHAKEIADMQYIVQTINPKSPGIIKKAEMLNDELLKNLSRSDDEQEELLRNDIMKGKYVYPDN